jgi:iron complex transport system permease protein
VSEQNECCQKQNAFKAQKTKMAAKNMNRASAKNRQGGKKIGFVIGLLLLLLAVSIVLGVSIGAVQIFPLDAYKVIADNLFGIGHVEKSGALYNVIWEIRFPRVLLGAVTGAGLALCGTVMQATVRNPLADPYLLGISAGASLGATFSIMLGMGSFGLFAMPGISVLAFGGALLASFLVLVLSGIGGKMTPVKLILSGTVINAFCGALSNFIISIASNAENMQTLKFWTMGSLAGAQWSNLPLAALAVLLCGAFFSTQFRTLNAMLLGDEAAVTLGIRISFYRRLYLAVVAALTGILVADCGIIGFVGLVIPHITRSLTGANHLRLVPVSLLTGAIFMIWADAFARIVLPGTELSIGIVTAMIGAPFFGYILIRHKYQFGE